MYKKKYLRQSALITICLITLLNSGCAMWTRSIKPPVPSCPQSVREKPALPPYPNSSNALKLETEYYPLVFAHTMQLWVSLNGAIDCLETLEKAGVLRLTTEDEK